MAFDQSAIDDGWCLDDETPKTPEKEPNPISYAPDKFTEAYWVEVERRNPAFIFGAEDHLPGSFGERMERAAGRLRFRPPPRVLEDWEERVGG